jgi:hypothetical protein
MAFTPQYRYAQAVRCRYLARKAQMLAFTLPVGDPIALRLIEFADTMEGDARRHDTEACLLLAEQAEDAIGGSLPARPI